MTPAWTWGGSWRSGHRPPGTWATPVAGRLVRFEGDAEGPDGAPGRVRAVVTADPATGAETTTPADTVVVGLGLAPRDILVRMAGTVPVTVVGEAAADLPLPPPPTEGVVCGCMGTTVADLGAAWDRGFTELELLKRSSQACLGTCQGGACLPNVRSWIAARTGVIPDPFTARPASRQITLAEASADTYVDAFRRTPLHDEHLAAGARMDRFGGWWRPWHYGDAVSEYWAVREGVSIGDVSTLGKLVVSGPDVVELLERLYPCHVADIKPGRSRYALLLNERGHVMDDGMILRDSETRFVLSFTSGGAANAEMWVRDWIDVWGLDVHVLDRTMSLAAINVTGPLAATLLRRAGLADPPRFLGHVRADVAGRPVPRHAPVVHGRGRLRAPPPGRPLRRAVARAAGRSAGTSASGRTASRRCSGCGSRRATSSSGWTPSSTRRRAGSGWTGRSGWRSRGSSAGPRSSGPPKLEDHRRWLGFTMDGPAPTEGSPIWSEGEIVGNVTGSWHSPLFGKALMLGWLRRTPFPTHGRDRRPRGRRHADPVLRPGGPPCPRLSGSTACASSRTRPRSTRRRWQRSDDVTVLRLAPDDAFAIGADGRRDRRPARHRRIGARLRRRLAAARSRRPPHRMVAPDRAPGPRPGRGRQRPGPPLAPRRRRRPPDHGRRLRRRAREPPPMSAYTDTLPAIRWPDAPKSSLRRRHRRWRRARPVDRVLPRDPPRHHQRRGPRGRLHRVRQHRPQHHDHPRQLRHPRGDPLLPALARDVPGRSRTRPAPRSSTRPRASSGSPTPRWRCAPSAPAP